MSSLAELSQIVGFFSYSRDDDADSHGALSALRSRIQGELRGQLGRTAKTFRLWHDKEAIPSGTLWESEIKNAAAQSVFFIPIITPTVVASPYCKFELESFLAREAALGRDDLVFPILYIDVPGLEDAAERNDPVLSLIAKRQYVDWRKLRHRDVGTTDASEAIERFCTHIRNALRRDWVSPEERKQQEEAAAQRLAETERQRPEVEVKRRADEEAWQQVAEEKRREREAEAERRREAEAESRADDERRQREAEAQRQKAEAERQKADRAQAEEQRRLRRAQARPLWPPSRLLLVAASVLAAAVAGLGLWLFAMSPRPSTLSVDAVSALRPDQEQALRPKDTFKECANCPQMIVVPAGSFTMGSPTNEPGRSSNEGPQRTVTIARQYAVGQFELTFDQWDTCVADGGCNGYKPSDQGWGRGYRPVINVSWDDAKAYVAWLAKKTDKFWYRLLTEAEYEYAARAGTTTAYPWGSAIGKNNANCDGCGSQWDGKQTAPVGSFAANGFCLYDMVGNVSAWTEDCYHDSYSGAPTDGSAWTSGDCSRHILRGGSWLFNPWLLRSASRNTNITVLRNSNFGFRVGRTLLTP
jgi:formylglycine-generating enzyme required for sulfatase activity